VQSVLTYPQVQVSNVDGVGQHDADGQQPAAEGKHKGRHSRLHRVQHEAVAVDSNQQEAERRDVHRDVLQHRAQPDVNWSAKCQLVPRSKREIFCVPCRQYSGLVMLIVV